LGGLAAWLGVGLPIWLQLDQTKPAAFAGWLAAWIVFALALWATTAAGERDRRIDLRRRRARW
jgi:hypothetical protein